MQQEEYKDVKLVTFGPFEAPVYRVDDRYRLRMVLKCRLDKPTLAMLTDLLCSIPEKLGRNVSLSVDLNPSNL